MERTRIIIYTSNTALEAQALDSGRTVVGKKFKFTKGNKVEQAKIFGKEFAQMLADKKITKISYDRNGFKYHGKVKSFAEGLREAKVEF